MGESPKTLVFHLGTVKTGSTLIQKFGYQHREDLQKAGLDYIQFMPPKLNLPRYANADILLQDAFDQDYVADCIRSSPCDTILISEEALWTRPNVLRHEVFAGHDIKVVLCVRAAANLVASWAGECAQPYNYHQKEFASGRGVVPVDEGMRILCERYKIIMRNFLEFMDNFPGAELTVVPYDDWGRFEEGLLQRFLSAIGIDYTPIADVVNNYGNTRVNFGRSRKFCDVSAKTAEIMTEYELGRLYNLSLVEAINERVQSGDSRGILKTITPDQIANIDQVMEPIHERFEPYYPGLTELLRRDASYASSGEEAPYQPVDETEVRLAVSDYLIRNHIKA